MKTAFVLDTCVISETSLPRPRESVIAFLASADNYFIPAGALMELQMGITKVCATNPLKAVKLSAWYNDLKRAGIPIIDTDADVSEICGILSVDPRLESLRRGQDLHIAAAALSRRLPIATLNVDDFLRIDACYPLPGIYDPLHDRWHVRMEPLADLYPVTEDRSEEMRFHSIAARQ
ncbi:type II toxin-antitoxin system VapC family toxin [Rhizobium ruizarguesonis]|jgi:predicted nucleic acid-binding protein|uniref:PIN domain-containing protein n=1 Tax=Rhizobium ruizarguesonis TaxID=2081791 RepID=UPI0010308401|nr:PIN domain-containing protein [Rhizobium ruizarguesonis]TAV21356.1 type II toxin-antitoxin system VapC family toxin [Rhizobium ruizarguesonis]